MPFDHGCRLHQHDGVQGLWPKPVKPDPQKPVRGEKLRTAWALASQDRHLVPKRDEFEFQRGAATKAEGEQSDERIVTMPTNGRAAAQKSLGFLSVLEF
jgi:hypothetical protein